MTCWGLLVLVFFGYAAFLSAGVIGRNYGVVAIHRNFYGVLKVVAKRMEHPTDVDYLQLKNGGVLHGGQFLDEKLQMVPTTYFSRESGVGRAFSLLDATAGRRVGVVGLGAGTVAAYGRKGDYFRFYEINPAVVFFAARYFTYCKHLAQVGAQLEPAVGDARLLLQRESSQQFDLLVVDAFSGDAIPMHLLTREAGALYFHHLKPTGILAVHISNRHLDLLPVVKGMVAGSAMDIAPIDNPPGKLAVAFSSWVLVGRPGSLKGLAQFSEPAAADTAGKVVVWTDGYSSLFRSLR
jgi:spermidine synthase